jgi:hypothetical protein
MAGRTHHQRYEEGCTRARALGAIHPGRTELPWPAPCIGALLPGLSRTCAQSYAVCLNTRTVPVAHPVHPCTRRSMHVAAMQGNTHWEQQLSALISVSVKLYMQLEMRLGIAVLVGQLNVKLNPAKMSATSVPDLMAGVRSSPAPFVNSNADSESHCHSTCAIATLQPADKGCERADSHMRLVVPCTCALAVPLHSWCSPCECACSSASAT